MSEEMIEYDVTAAHIVQAPGYLGGKPFIVGSKTRVQDIYIWHELVGVPADEIASQHRLTMAQVYAALTFAYDNLDQIEASIEIERRMGKQMAPFARPEFEYKLAGD